MPHYYSNARAQGGRFEILFFATTLLRAPGLLAQPSLTIGSPAAGTVVAPGQTLTVTVQDDPPGSVAAVGIAANWKDVTDQTTGRNKFLFTVPAKLAPGEYTLTPLAFSNNDLVKAEGITVDVELSAPQSSITCWPSSLTDLILGERRSFQVTAIMPDQSTWSVSESSRITVTSADPSIVSVDENRDVHAVAPGSTTITVAYGTQTITVPASVLKPLQISPGMVGLYPGQKTTFFPKRTYATAPVISWSVVPDLGGR